MFQLDKLIKAYVKEEEKLVAVIRECIIANILLYAILIGSYFLWLFLMAWLFKFGQFGVIIFLLGLFVLLIFTIRHFIIWYFDVMILTDQRFIDIQRTGVFTKHVQIITWSMVQQVSYAQTGILAILGHYGNIIITLKSGQVITMQHVVKPQLIREMLASYVKI
ncbi:MAG: PH domain-containing protein [Patescibacteria group bacterium]|jgi:hypothetical protein